MMNDMTFFRLIFILGCTFSFTVFTNATNRELKIATAAVFMFSFLLLTVGAV